MGGILVRTAWIAGALFGLSGCADSALSTGFSGSGASELELRQLPATSKVYFRRRLTVPARTGRVWIAAESGASPVGIELILDPAEVDRVIDPSTPLLVERTAGFGRADSRDACGVTLFLTTSGGVALRFRVVRSKIAAACSPPTVGDIAEITHVVPSPPVPIQ